jgi:hypothetical protein
MPTAACIGPRAGRGRGPTRPRGSPPSRPSGGAPQGRARRHGIGQPHVAAVHPPDEREHEHHPGDPVGFSSCAIAEADWVTVNTKTRSKNSSNVDTRTVDRRGGGCRECGGSGMGRVTATLWRRGRVGASSGGELCARGRMPAGRRGTGPRADPGARIALRGLPADAPTSSRRGVAVFSISNRCSTPGRRSPPPSGSPCLGPARPRGDDTAHRHGAHAALPRGSTRRSARTSQHSRTGRGPAGQSKQADITQCMTTL